ncbi:hypothetical protein GCM10009801_43720 [Streptomyces albiaxialis]|uniref:MmpS family membrane protein n=1 Tax=Streptomyces albiaxialis TaxID=329523 RepID=A0ABN2W5B6_9ACTN
MRPPRPRTAAAAVAALAVTLGGCSLGPLGEEDEPEVTKTFLEPMKQESAGRTVVYEVRGPGTASVRYEDSAPGKGSDTTLRDSGAVRLPWKKTVKVPEGTERITLTATSSADHSATPLACTVLVDGELASSDSVDSSQASCTTELPEK